MMTVHVLHAGNGYEYLTRQVAHGDVHRDRGQDLASYYTADGCPPGQWIGAGAVALQVAGAVDEEQMKALFGEGLHPDAEARFVGPARERWTVDFTARRGRAATEAEIASAAPKWRKEALLGREFPTFDTSREEAWKSDVAERLGRLATEADLPVTGAPAELRRQARLDVGRVWFKRDRGRPPATSSELQSYVTRAAKPTPQPVAGYDCVFSPVKSVSLLWALGDPTMRAAIQDAHHAAVADAIGYLEQEATFTRAGKAGVRQVDAKGLVAAAFDHFDSRAGDPDLHTHVAIANRVQGPDGKWRSLDGRVVHDAAVSASERYNTTLEREVADRLGVAFEACTKSQDKRQVREVVGVDEDLVKAFSQRRNGIEDRFNDLLAAYRAEHGRSPSTALQHQMAQRATLETRQAKKPNESLATKVQRWQAQAAELGVADLPQRCLAAGEQVRRDRDRDEAPGGPAPAALAERVVETLESERSRWKVWQLRAEADRQVREHAPHLDVAATRTLVEQVVTIATGDGSILLSPPQQAVVPAELQRGSGQSVYRVAGRDWYSSATILAAEARLLDATAAPAHAPVDAQILTAVLATRTSRGQRALDPGQEDLVRHFVSTERLVAVGVGPAGAGKTTAMAAVVEATTQTGHRVVAVAPSAAAAAVLSADIGAPATTIAKLLHDAEHQPARVDLRAGDLLLVDEAGMAATLDLARLVDLARQRGAVVRLLGDPAQLAAVEAGGAFRLLASRTPAAELSTLHRFSDPAEAAATLLFRDGHPGAADWYVDHNRVRSGTREELLDQLYADWRSDVSAGRSSVMLAADRDTVRELAVRARLDRVADGEVTGPEAQLQDGTHAAAGDVIVTRRNDRRLPTDGGRDFVKNGDLWIVEEVNADGSLEIRPCGAGFTATGARLSLPASYVEAHVELGYASTINRAQGLTADASRTLLDGRTSREQGYVAGTRGRDENVFYAVTETTIDLDLHHGAERPTDARALLQAVIDRTGAEVSATETIAAEMDAAESLSQLVPQYEDARGALAAHSGRVDELLGQVLNAHQLEQLRHEPAWNALADRVRDLDDRPDVDATAALAAAIASGLGTPLTSPNIGPGAGDAAATVPAEPAASDGLARTRDAAAVLAWRLEREHPRDLVATWLTRAALAGEPPSPSTAGGGPDTTSGNEDATLTAPTTHPWLTETRQRILARIQHQAQQLATEQPEFLHDLLGPPRDLERDPLAAAGVRAIAAYRDRYQVTTADGPQAGLSDEPTDAAQRNDWRAVHALAERVRTLDVSLALPRRRRGGELAARNRQAADVAGQQLVTPERIDHPSPQVFPDPVLPADLGDPGYQDPGFVLDDEDLRR